MGTNHLMARLLAYAPNGSIQGPLPHPMKWEMSAPLSDIGSLTLAYPKNSPAIELLSGPVEVAVEIRNPTTGAYTEMGDSRFLNLKRSQNLLDRPGVVAYTMPSYGWMLRKVRFLSSTGLNADGRRPIVKGTAGSVMKQIFDESKARDNIPGLTYGFTATHDSNGAAWPDEFNAEYDHGQDAWSILDALARQGFCDWRFNKRALEMYVVDTVLRRELAGDSGFAFHPHASHIEEPTERTWEDLATTLLVVGDEQKSKLVQTPVGEAEAPWGRWEEAFNAGGVGDVATMTLMGERALEGRVASRLQLTKQLVWRDGSPVPLIDYRPGDMVRARTEDGVQNEPVRVYQISLATEDPYGLSVNLTLNDRFTERGLRNERWINRISGSGGPGTGGGTGGSTKPKPPDPVDPSGRKPGVPQNVQVGSTSYFNERGEPVGRAELSFDAVVTGADGAAMVPGWYMFYARRIDLSFDLSINGQVDHPDGAVAGTRLKGLISNLDAGFQYDFAVRAVSQAGHPGAWSSVVRLMIQYPVQPMPTPSTPELTSRLGTVKVEWDGLTSTGVTMPARFREVQVEMSKTGSGPWTHIGEIFVGGSAVIVTGGDSQLTWSIGDRLYFRFTARDSASNFSESESAVASIIVVGVTGPDIMANSVTTNHLTAGSVTADKVRAYSMTVDRLSVGEPSNLVADPSLTDPDLNAHRLLVANASSAAGGQWTLSGGVAKATVAGAGTLRYSRFYLGNNVMYEPFLSGLAPLPKVGLVTQLTRSASTNIGGLKARFRLNISNAGTWAGGARVVCAVAAKFYDRSGAQIANYYLSSQVPRTGPVNTLIESSAESGVQPPVGTVAADFFVFTEMNGVPLGTTVSISEFSVWQEQSIYIGDGMIKSPLIQADGITTRELDAQTLTVKHTIRSSYYEMRSASPARATWISISQNANYAGQAGIKFHPEITSMSAHPGVFIVDAEGTGGWDANAFVITGPEQTTNSSGRVDVQLAYGITNTSISRSHGASTANAQGIFWPTNNAQLRFGGSFPSGSYTNDLFRAGKTGFPNGYVAWGAVNKSFWPMLTGNASTTPGYSSIWQFSRPTGETTGPRNSSEGFWYKSSSAVGEVYYLAFSGGSI